jgi:hypothetical protein
MGCHGVPWVPDLRLPRVKWSMMCSSSGMPCVRSLGISRWLGHSKEFWAQHCHHMLHLFDHVYPLLYRYVYHCLSIGYVCDTAVEELHFCVGCPQVLRKQVRRCQCQAWRSQPCNSTLTTAVTVPVCCRGLRHAKCQEIGHLYKLMDDHNIFKQYVQDLVYGEIRRKPNP